MASPQIQFRAISELATYLEQRSEAGKSASQVAQRDLERYYSMLMRSLPKFSISEALMLCDIMNGSIYEYYTAPLLWAEVSDALQEGYAEKWEVDGPALVERLRRLTPFECMAVVDAAERAWNSPAYRIDNMKERVRKVGLVKE